MRVFYQADPNKADNISAATNYNECNNSPSAPVKVKEDLYDVELSCQGTAIYPGGESKYRKKIELQLINNSASNGLFNNFTGIFAQPLKVINLSLYNNQELIWGKYPV